MSVWTPERLSVWALEHLSVWGPAHLSALALEPLSVCASQHLRHGPARCPADYPEIEFSYTLEAAGVPGVRKWSKKFPGGHKKSSKLRFWHLPKMSRKGSQNTKNDDYFPKFSSQRCKATESLRCPSISKMTRRAYLARMCMLDRVIRGRGRASLNFSEKWHLRGSRGRFFKVWVYLTIRFHQNNFFITVQLKRKSHAQYGLQIFPKSRRKAWIKIVRQGKNMTKTSIFW